MSERSFAMVPSLEGAALREQVNYPTRAMILEMCVRLSLRVPGNIVEFGVADGASTRVIRRSLRRYRRRPLVPHGRKRIFALDSFEGLSEKFENAPQGTFAGSVPRVPHVEFVKGYFQDTCNDALARRVGRVAFAHLDADLYESTLTALRWLTPLLSPGSLLLFDQFIGEQQSECRAFDVWRKERGVTVTRLAEFDRDPSGFGSRPDRRLLYQVLGDEPLAPRDSQGSMAWSIAYYMRRLGLEELRSRFLNRY